MALLSWTLSLRLGHETAELARSVDLADAVTAATSGLSKGVARAALAAGEGGNAGAERLTAAGGAGRLDDYWQAEADATRQLDILGVLALEPELGWTAVPLAGLHDAALSQMAALDEMIRPAQGNGGPLRDSASASVGGGTRLLAETLIAQVDDRRRELVSRSAAAASLDRRELAAAAAAGGVLLSALGLAVLRHRPEGEIPTTTLLAAGKPAKAASAAWPVMGGAAPSDRLSGQRTTGLRVLLVEDNAMVRFSLEAMLSDLGHAVVTAGDAAGAIGLAESDPDVLVTDLGLPDLDGLTLAARLRARQPSLRVVVASGRPGSAPDTVWLQKPFGLDQLRRAVEASAARIG